MKKTNILGSSCSRASALSTQSTNFIHIIISLTQRQLFLHSFQVGLGDLIIVNIEGLAGPVNLILFAEHLFNLSKVSRVFAASKLNVIELDLLTASELSSAGCFEAEFNNEVGEDFVKNALRGVQGVWDIAVCIQEVLN